MYNYECSKQPVARLGTAVLGSAFLIIRPPCLTTVTCNNQKFAQL